MMAATGGSLPMVQWLLSAEVGARVSQADDRGRTALMIAASQGNIPIVRWLLSPEGGASLNETDREGATALFHATDLFYSTHFCGEKNQYAMMLYLLDECGADINHAIRGDGAEPATIWDWLQCEVFGDAHTALTPLLKVVTLLGDAPASLKPRLSAEHSLIMQEGPLLRARLPTYLQRRQRLLLAHCPLPCVLHPLVAAYATPDWADTWATRLC
jgi:hypothetical protein